VQSKEFTAKQVVSRCDVSGELHVHTATVGQQSIHSPLAASVSIFVDFEPDVAFTIVGLGEVDNDGTEMGWVYDVVGGGSGLVMELDSN
jgi:hypothetical protein